MLTDLHSAPRHRHYDVVVVGARCAGASTALLLARAGLKVLVVDRAGPGRDTLSTHSVARAGVLQLSRWDVLDALRAAGTPRAQRAVFRYGDDVVDVPIEPRGEVDGLYSPRRTVLDTALAVAAAEAGAEVRYGVGLRRLRRDGAGRVDGVVLDAGGRRVEVTARYVVGADGMRSRVAEDAGAYVYRRETTAAACLYAYFTGFADDLIQTHFGGSYGFGVIPTNDGAANVWVGLPAARYRAQGRPDVEATFRAGVAAAAPELVEAVDSAARVSPWRSFPGEPGFVRQCWGSGWVLVGDATYFKDPISAHGITDALIGAELAADALVAAVGGTDEREALSGYQRQRDALAAPMIPAVARAAAYDGDLPALMSAFRDMSKAMKAEWEFLVGRADASVVAA